MSESIEYEDFDDAKKGLGRLKPAEACVLAAMAVVEAIDITRASAGTVIKDASLLSPTFALCVERLSVDVHRLNQYLANSEAWWKLSRANPETILRYKVSAHSYAELAYLIGREVMRECIAFESETPLSMPAKATSFDFGKNYLLNYAAIAKSDARTIQRVAKRIAGILEGFDHRRLRVDLAKEHQRSESIAAPDKSSELNVGIRIAPQPDGPTKDGSFRFGGVKSAKAMSPQSHKLINAIWDLPDQAALWEDIEVDVFGDIADDNQKGAAVRRANDFFEAEKIPLQLRQRKLPEGKGVAIAANAPASSGNKKVKKR